MQRNKYFLFPNRFKAWELLLLRLVAFRGKWKYDIGPTQPLIQDIVQDDDGNIVIVTEGGTAVKNPECVVQVCR